jgi:hypothetical protein
MADLSPVIDLISRTGTATRTKTLIVLGSERQLRGRASGLSCYSSVGADRP